MRPQPKQVFRTDAASRLDDLELIAALLERDATRVRSERAEHGAILLPTPRRRRRHYVRRLHAVLVRGRAVCRRVGAGIRHAALHPRLFSGVRAVSVFVVDLSIVLSAAIATMAALTLAYLLAAPP